MGIKLLISLISIIATSGCQSTNSSFPIEKPITPNLSQELEGTKHRVWKEASYKAIRSEIADGEAYQ